MKKIGCDLGEQGIVFFCGAGGTVQWSLLAVAIHSLTFDGSVCVVVDKRTPKRLIKDLWAYDQIEVITMDCPDGHRKRSYWMKKVDVACKLPFRYSLVLDCDHVFFNPIPDVVFEDIRSHGVVTSSPPTPKWLRRKMRRRAIQIRDVTQCRYRKYHQITNGGFVGIDRESRGASEWGKWNQLFTEKAEGQIRRVSDEYSLGYLIHLGLAQAVNPDYSRVGRPRMKSVGSKVVSVHFANCTYASSPLFVEHYESAFRQNTLSLASVPRLIPHGAMTVSRMTKIQKRVAKIQKANRLKFTKG